MVDQTGDTTEQRQDPYERLDPLLVEQAYLDNEYAQSRRGGPSMSQSTVGSTLINREALLDKLRIEVGALYDKAHSTDDPLPRTNELVEEYQAVFEKVGYLSTIKGFERFIALRQSITTGQPILDGDDVVFIAENDGNPVLHVDKASDDELNKPERYLSWKVEVLFGVPDKTTVIVDNYTSIGKEAIIKEVQESLSYQLRGSYLTVEGYERALAILTAVDAKEEIEELKGDAARSALNNFERIGPIDYDSTLCEYLDLLSLTDSEAFQELLDRMAKRIANSGVPRTEDMIFYSALDMHQESAADDPFEEPYRLHAMFDLYESEHDRGVLLLEQEKLAEEAKSFAH